MALKDGFVITRPVELGRIAIGKKNEKGFPTKLDHFIFTKTEPNDKQEYEIDKDVRKAITDDFGDKPKSIAVILPFDTPDEVFYTTYANYRKRVSCDCYGDGETAKRNVGGEWQTVPCGYADCEYKVLKRDGKADMVTCKPRGILSVWLPSVNRIGGVFRFRTSGKNTIGNIVSTLDQFYKMRGTLMGLTCRLTVYPKLVVTDASTGATQKVYVVRLEYDGSLDEMIKSKGVFGQRPAQKELSGSVIEPGEIKDEEVDDHPEIVVPEEVIGFEDQGPYEDEDPDDF